MQSMQKQILALTFIVTSLMVSIACADPACGPGEKPVLVGRGGIVKYKDKNQGGGTVIAEDVRGLGYVCVPEGAVIESIETPQ